MFRPGERDSGQRFPAWAVGWHRELLRQGASFVELTPEVNLEEIPDPHACIICAGQPTKAFVPHSVVSNDRRLVVGTSLMPGYRCDECCKKPELGGESLGPTIYLSGPGIIGFETKAAEVFMARGHTNDAILFLKSAAAKSLSVQTAAGVHQ